VLQAVEYLADADSGEPPGAAAADAIPALDVAEQLLLAVAAGVLAQAARISLRAAFPSFPSGRRITTAPAASVLIAASLTALAVRGMG
jgi:hypothetical protein